MTLKERIQAKMDFYGIAYLPSMKPIVDGIVRAACDALEEVEGPRPEVTREECKRWIDEIKHSFKAYHFGVPGPEAELMVYLEAHDYDPSGFERMILHIYERASTAKAAVLDERKRLSELLDDINRRACQDCGCYGYAAEVVLKGKEDEED